MNEQTSQVTTDTSVAQKTFLPKTINVKIFIIIVLLLVLAGLAYYYRSAFVAATVNGKPISRLAVVHKLEEQSGKAALDLLIDEHLVAQEAQAQKLSVSQEDIDAELNMIKAQLTGQGTSLDAALKAEGLTLDALTEQIRQQVLVEKLLGDKVVVTDDEINAYISDNKIDIPDGQDGYYKQQIRAQLKSDKFNNTAPQYLDALRAKAKIKYWVTY